jgi:hypothetical protein
MTNSQQFPLNPTSQIRTIHSLIKNHSLKRNISMKMHECIGIVSSSGNGFLALVVGAMEVFVFID